jgi:RNA polymerase sigma-70 factor (ECF subfamily)
MPMPNQDTTAPEAGQFTSTHWSIVLMAGQNASAPGQEALEKLCRTYWYPLYAYVRRQGHGVADAQDLTQEFFARLLSKNFLANVTPEKGKFRSFLLAAMKHFLANEWDRVRAEKRGGKQTFISLDETHAEDRYALEPADISSPESLFEKRWAWTILDRAWQRLKEENADEGKKELFSELKVFLSREASQGAYGAVASRLKMSAGAVAVAVHRLRQRYAQLLRVEIGQTVSSAADIDGEMRYLFGIINK